MVIVLSSTVFGQTTFGIKGGVNIANMKFREDGVTLTNQTILGLMVGGFASVEINDRLLLLPELLFAQYGCNVSKDDTGTGSDSKYSENYLSIPLKVKYSFGSFNIQAGPQLGLLLTASIDGEDAMDGMKRFDYGVNLGVGFELGNVIGLEARYYLGLANVIDDSEQKFTNSGIQVLVTYRFK